MAADDRIERGLSAGLHAWLDPAALPHPHWDGSPAQQAVASADLPAARPRRRPAWTIVLVAAALVLLALVALWAGGRLEQHPPIVPPRNGLVANPTAISPTPSATPAPSAASDRASSSPDQSGDGSAAPCLTQWSHDGAISPAGLVDGIRVDVFSGEGELVLAFGHTIDSVQRISIAPTQPLFVTPAGNHVHVAGSAFYQLTLRGLTRPTPVDLDMVQGVHEPPYLPTVSAPIAEMRRIRTPRVSRPVDGPKGDSTETWIIGLDEPECLVVRTVRTAVDLHDEPGDNTVVIAFDPPPLPVPSG